jgi:hypothetical protein
VTPAASIQVKQIQDDEGGYSFDVRIEEAGEVTTHRVTMSRADYQRLGSGTASPEEFVQKCFGFLLEREPKESILGRFDVAVIGRYFPEFEREVAGQRPDQ